MLMTALSLLPATLSAMNGYRRIGYGVQAQGVGGAAIAFPQDAFAAVANPAGLGDLCDRIDIGVDWVRQNQRVSVPIVTTNGADECDSNHFGIHSDDDFFYPELALNRWVGCDQALGLAIYGFGGWQTEYPLAGDRPFHTLGVEGPTLGMEYRQYFITPTWAWKMNDCQTIGVSFNLAVGWLGTRGLRDPLITGIDSAAPAYVSDRGKDYEFGAGVKVGWLGDLFCGLVGGVSYQSPTWINKFKSYRGFIASDGDMHLPDIWGIGLSYCFCGQVVLAMDIERIMWSHTHMFRHDLFTQGTNSSSRAFGTPSGVGFGWDDQTVFKIGLAWDICDWGTARIGYNWGENPVDVDSLVLNVLTQQVLVNHFTLGLTWYWSCCGELSFSYIHGTARTIHHENFSLRNKQDSIGLAFGRVF
jgi:long-chain fatty acid transport protein